MARAIPCCSYHLLEDHTADYTHHDSRRFIHYCLIHCTLRSLSNTYITGGLYTGRSHSACHIRYALKSWFVSQIHRILSALPTRVQGSEFPHWSGHVSGNGWDGRLNDLIPWALAQCSLPPVYPVTKGTLRCDIFTFGTVLPHSQLKRKKNSSIGTNK